MFIGYFAISSDAWFLLQSENTSGIPVAADALPTFRVYGGDSSTPKATGTATVFDSPTLTGCYKVTFTISGAFERGLNYNIVTNWQVSVQDREKVFSLSIY